MSTASIKTSEWLEDIEIRAEYGSATLKYDIASALVAARKMRNLTQAALAKIAGVSQAYIAKLESGEANPTIGRIGAIFAAIWLKAEIDLVPIVPSSYDGISEQKQAVEALTATASHSATSEDAQWVGLQPLFHKPNVPYHIDQEITTGTAEAIQETGLRETKHLFPTISYPKSTPEMFLKGFNPTSISVDALKVPEQHTLH